MARLPRASGADVVAIASLAAAAGFVFRASLTGSALYLGDFDRASSFLNVLRHHVEGLKQGHLIAWSDAMFMGWNTLALPYTFPNPLTLLAAASPISELFWVSALISLGLLVLAGWSAYAFLRELTGQPFAAFVGAMLYQFSAFSVLKVSQNDMSFAVAIHLPLALLVLRGVARRSLARSLLYLTPIIASLFLFTFLQKVAYGGMLLGLYALYRSWVERSWRPFVVLCLASAVGLVAAAPRVLTVADELRFLDRGYRTLEPLTFEQVYRSQNLPPRDVLRWLDAGIFGRHMSEMAALGNSVNLHEGMLLWGSTFAALLLLVAAVWQVASLARRPGCWRVDALRRADDVPFYVAFLLLVFAVFAIKPVTQLFFIMFGGLDFTHARIVVAGLIVQAALVALGLRALLHQRGSPASHVTAATVAAGVIGGVALYGAVTLISARGGTETLAGSATLAHLARLNAQLLLTGDVQAPQAPVTVAIAVVSQSQADLTWSAADGAAAYVIELEGTGEPGFRGIGRLRGDVTGFRATGLTTGETYRVRIRSCGTVTGDGACSEPSPATEISLPPPRVAPPAVPPTPFVTAKGPAAVELRWPDHESHATYHVEVRGRGNERFREVATLASGAAVGELRDLRPSARYTIRVRACAENVCSAFGRETTVEADARGGSVSAASSESRPADPPSAPSATAASPVELRVAWQPVAGADAYAIEAKGETDPEFAEVARVRDGTTLGLPTRPDTSTSFRYRWCAADRCSLASPPTRITAPAALPPLVPPSTGELWFVTARSMLKIEWSALALGVLLLVLVKARRAPKIRALLVVVLGVAMLSEAVAYADDQINGDQNRTPLPFARNDFALAGPGAFRIPSPETLRAYRETLELDRHRAVIVCEAGQVMRICAPHIAALWGLRLVDGYSSGIPKRLAGLPWSNDVLGLRAISFTSFETLPWPMLSFLGVKHAVGATPAFYVNVPVDGADRDLLPGDLKIVDNPLTPIPRELFAASVQPVVDFDEAVTVTFANGADAVPDVAARSIVEQYDGPLDLATDGSITAGYGDDEIDIVLSPSDRTRFLVLNELYHPLWRAEIDGRPARVYPTNVVMRGLIIPPGATQVHLRFEPFARLPVLASFVAVGAVLLLGGAWALRQFERGLSRMPGLAGLWAARVRAEPDGPSPRDRRRFPGRVWVWIRGRPFLSISLAIAGWLSFEYLALGPYSWMYGYGASLETVPVHLALAQTGSTWSLWAPSVAGGLDRLSFWGNADPFNVEPLLFAALPAWLANGLHVLTQRFIGAYFTARVCADQLRLSRGWCALAVLIHAGIGYFTIGETLTISAVPLLLWLLPMIAERRRWWAWAPLAGVLYSTTLTFSQGAPYLLVFSVGWCTLVLARTDWRLYAVVGIFFAALSLIELPQTLATLANVPFSHRAGLPTEPIFWTPSGLLYLQLQFDFLAQGDVLRLLAFGLPPVALGVGLAAVLIRRSRRRESILFLRVAALYGLLSLKVGWLTAQTLAMMVFPWLGGLYMGRFYTLPAPFVIAIMTMLAANVLAREARPAVLRRMPIVALAGAVVMFLVGPKVNLYYPLMVDSWGEKSYQVPALEALKRSDTGVYRVASVLDLQPAYAYAQGFETADGWSNLYPAYYRELWLRVIAPLLAALPDAREVFDPPVGRPQDHYIFLGLSLGRAPIGPLPGEDPRQALRSGFDLDRRFNMPLLSMLNVKYVLSRFPLRGEGARLIHEPSEPPRLLDNYDYATGLLNRPASHLADVALTDWPARIVADGLDAIDRKRDGKDVYIYENTRVLPRFRLVPRVEVLDSGRAVLDRLAGMSVDELEATAVLERSEVRDAELPSLSPSSAPGDVAIACSTPDEIVLRSRSQSDGFLVIGNTWNPAWRATIDEMPARLVRTNHAQLGVPMPTGNHVIRLHYEPWYGGPLALTSRLISRVCNP